LFFTSTPFPHRPTLSALRCIIGLSAREAETSFDKDRLIGFIFKNSQKITQAPSHQPERRPLSPLHRAAVGQRLTGRQHLPSVAARVSFVLRRVDLAFYHFFSASNFSSQQ
jgi:hypothetical protein